MHNPFLKNENLIRKKMYVVPVIVKLGEESSLKHTVIINESKIGTYSMPKLREILHNLFDDQHVTDTKANMVSFLETVDSQDIIKANNQALLGTHMGYKNIIDINMISGKKGKEGVLYYDKNKLKEILIGLFDGVHKSDNKPIMAQFLLEPANIKIIEFNNSAISKR